ELVKSKRVNKFTWSSLNAPGAGCISPMRTSARTKAMDCCSESRSSKSIFSPHTQLIKVALSENGRTNTPEQVRVASLRGRQLGKQMQRVYLCAAVWGGWVSSQPGQM